MRMILKELPSPEFLREMFSYDSITGDLRHKARRHGAKHGEIVGRVDKDGYRTVNLYGLQLRVHRIVWTMIFDAWPEAEIDHINNDPGDNSISNLRISTRSQNKANCRKPVNGSNPYKGITRVQYGKQGYKWRAQICKDGQRTYLGFFDDPAEAHAVYMSAAISMFGEFANAG